MGLSIWTISISTELDHWQISRNSENYRYRLVSEFRTPIPTANGSLPIPEQSSRFRRIPMKKALFSILSFLLAGSVYAQLNTFSEGDVISAEQMNQNFE